MTDVLSSLCTTFPEFSPKHVMTQFQDRNGDGQYNMKWKSSRFKINYFLIERFNRNVAFYLHVREDFEASHLRLTVDDALWMNTVLFHETPMRPAWE